MRAPGIIAAQAANAMLSMIAGRGDDADDLSARVGIVRSSLCGASNVVPLAKFTSMLETAAMDRGSDLFGVELGKAFQAESLGPIASLFTTSATVGEALRKFTRYFPTIQSNTKITISIDGDVARMSYAIDDPTVKFRLQDAHFSVAFEYSLLSKLLGSRSSITAIDFQHAYRDAYGYKAYFDCPVRLGQRDNAIYFLARSLDAPIYQANEAASLRLERELADAMRITQTQLDLVAGIEAWMAAAISRSASIDIEDAASDFGISLRSFQRKLADYNINYLEIRNRVRTQIASCMLSETRLPVTTIGIYLGYSETSAFSRGFKKMTGRTPAEFRTAAAAETGG